VFEFLQDLQLSGGDVVQWGIFEGDDLHGEGPLRLLADGLVDTAVGSLPDLLDQFEGRHLPKIYNTFRIKSASVKSALISYIFATR
jgi:hypothetical protein